MFNLLPQAIRPSFPQNLLTRSAYTWSPDGKLRKTSYMDGIRGLAAFLVVIHHWTDMDFVHTSSAHGFWNYEQPGADRQLWRLPIVRLLYNGGHAMVPIFFVISGFSLAYKPVEYIRARKFDKLLLNLSSSMLRRAPRLCLPPIVMTFFVFIAIRLGWYDNRPLPQPLLEHFPSIITQFKDWIWDVTYLPDAFSWDFVIWLKYQPHTWTLNTELQGSKWVYMTILACCTLRQTPRLVVLAWWCLYCLWHLKYWTFLFCSGVFIAETHHVGEALEAKAQKSHSLYHPLQTVDDAGTSRKHGDEDDIPLAKVVREDDDHESRVSAYPASSNLLGDSENVIAYSLLFIGLFFCSAPYDEPQTKYMWWNTLWRWCPVPVPQPSGQNHDYHEMVQRVYMGLGSVMTVFAISRLPSVQRFFEVPAMQYLGKVSFGLYLIHGPIIMTVGWATLPVFWSWFKVGSYWPPVQWDGASQGPIYKDASRFWIEIAHWLCLGCMLPCMFWGADLFTRFIDEPILRATKRVHEKFAVS
ncbi:protein of unknown function [Taphrina deformans PYCC 5710]|uniref:Acyltransferase 3 domain-containing protein n=1 Tax=Taphrina deformans (strain PYCC 5710 / ATCC 11124 / CBS 356.35 / IMI 108563 / JCM 9778 / NBRC 8474) TaxID=1097556 RepID=R4XCU0_TAPDE|nr:protein of unknown function [Taphrina deformans PYCC 5710]|eukprot:CCG83680.1 protein of unknown function [Taphrina deformans PYCC 5710]